MEGKAARQATMLTAVTPDVLVPQCHPIRRIKLMVDQALAQLSSTVTACILYGIRYATSLRAASAPASFNRPAHPLTTPPKYTEA